MEKLPTIILPTGSEAEATTSPRPGVWERTKTPSSTSLLRLGGIRLRCPRPQQLVKDFYVKRLGMQELTLLSSPPSRSESNTSTDALEFKLLLPPRQQLHQLLQQSSSIRSQNNRRSLSSSRTDLTAALNEGGLGRHRTSLKDYEGQGSRMSSRRTSFGSQCSMGGAPISGTSRFAAFEFFTSNEVENTLNDASESGESNSLVNLSQHMVRVQPAGQFLDMSYAASFLDPHNFRGRLLQHMSEYKMATRKSLGDSKASSFNTPEAVSKALSPRKQKRPDSEHAEWPASPSEEGGDMQRSSLYSSFSSTHSSALSVAQAEREGCLPAPTPEEMSAVEAEELSTPEVTIRFDTLPLEGLPVLHHIELLAADAERTLTFYEEAVTNGTKVTRYHDLEPAECGFLGFSFLCSEANEQQLLERFKSKDVNVDHVDDEVYGRKVMQIRDPQNVPIRIVLTT
ncbi:hypothetical protein Emed_004759 [Eimeria media]